MSKSNYTPTREAHMFDSPEEARRHLTSEFEPALVEAIVAALVPSIVLAPSEHHRLGGTRLGGTPDLPPNLDWPRPPPLVDPEAIARRGNAEAEAAMREHFARRLPYTFLAQIDLEETAALGAVATSLPAEGRLLFFCELAVVLWETGTRVARVIWDRSPRGALEARDLPSDLAEAADVLQAEIGEVLAKLGRPPPSVVSNSYLVAPQPRRPKATLRLPNTHAIEIEAISAIAPCASLVGATDELEDLCLAYSDATESAGDYFPDELWKRHQLLGSPMPEQDDPRFEAVISTSFGEAGSRDAWANHRDRILAEAREWRLLLQVALLDWELAEGTVYFLIRAADLATRRFDGVVAVYQQT